MSVGNRGGKVNQNLQHGQRAILAHVQDSRSFRILSSSSPARSFSVVRRIARPGQAEGRISRKRRIRCASECRLPAGNLAPLAMPGPRHDRSVSPSPSSPAKPMRRRPPVLLRPNAPGRVHLLAWSATPWEPPGYCHNWRRTVWEGPRPFPAEPRWQSGGCSKLPPQQ